MAKSADQEKYLVKAVESLKRQIMVVSEHFDILALNIDTVKKKNSRDKIEKGKCHKVLFDRDRPCTNCPVITVKNTRNPSLNFINTERIDTGTTSCLYAYPLDSGPDEEKTIVVLDFHLPDLNDNSEKRLASNSFLRNLILSAVDGVIAADKTGQILIFNKAASEISGYTKEEALSSLNIKNFYPPGDAKKIMKIMRSEEYGRKGIIRSYKQKCIRKDGSEVVISLTASIVYENEEEVATIGFFHDLTETIKMENELKKTQTQLQQAEKMSSLGKLAAGVAHQLNNPLGGITLFSQLMLEEYDLSEDARTDVQRIKRDAERCKSIVKELLEFARQTKREVQLHNINQLIERTVFLLKNQALFHNIQLKLHLDENLPLIPADVQQINHVLMNIILNGADAMEGKGTLEVRTRLLEEKGMALVEICDSGPGIDEELLLKIFDPFFTTKEEGKGTGLGLSMAYGIIQTHQGRLYAANREEGGAVFSIELPVSSDSKQRATEE